MSTIRDVEDAVEIFYNFIHLMQNEKIVYNDIELSIDLFSYFVKFMKVGYMDNSSFARKMNVSNSAVT